MIEAIIEFLTVLFSGEFSRWRAERKIAEAKDAQDKISAMSDNDVSKRLSDDWTKH